MGNGVAGVVYCAAGEDRRLQFFAGIPVSADYHQVFLSPDMQNALGDAADAVLITAAKILDTLTYRLSDIATDTSVPNNNDTLVAPLTEKLATDLAKFNHVLDDYSLDVTNCRHLIESFCIKNEKEKVIKQEQEEQRLKEQKAKEEAELRAREQQEQEQKKQQQLQQQQQQQQQQKTEVKLESAAQGNSADNDLGLDLNGAGNDNDDLMLDLDLDNFKFDTGANDGMNFNFDEPNVTKVKDEPSQDTKAKQQPQQQQQQQMPQEQPQPISQSTNNATAGTEDYLNFGQDEELADLDLNFLEDGEMNELLGSNQGNDLNMNLDSGKQEDMEQLFSQFDEMVGNNL